MRQQKIIRKDKKNIYSSSKRGKIIFWIKNITCLTLPEEAKLTHEGTDADSLSGNKGDLKFSDSFKQVLLTNPNPQVNNPAPSAKETAGLIKSKQKIHWWIYQYVARIKKTQ